MLKKFRKKRAKKKLKIQEEESKALEKLTYIKSFIRASHSQLSIAEEDNNKVTQWIREGKAGKLHLPKVKTTKESDTPVNNLNMKKFNIPSLTEIKKRKQKLEQEHDMLIRELKSTRR